LSFLRTFAFPYAPFQRFHIRVQYAIQFTADAPFSYTQMTYTCVQASDYDHAAPVAFQL
jgi:hypothetical protein